ncbi:MAG TPA: helix-turn-helix transcriptional regulator [Chitinophagales bacterium]|nr:helix-turn-helix transcriptional regulator [Chitinophagales bacterium]
MEDTSLFAKNLRFLIKSKDINNSKLERDMGWGKNSVHNYVTGNNEPNYDRTIKIADYFSVSIDALLRHDMTLEGSANNKQSNNNSIHQINENGNNHAVLNHTQSEWEGLQAQVSAIDLVSLARQVRHHSLDQLNQYLVKVGAIHCPDLYTHFKTIDQLKPTESVIGQHSSDFLKLLRNAQRHEVLAPNRYELGLIRAEIDRILGNKNIRKT